MAGHNTSASSHFSRDAMAGACPATCLLLQAPSPFALQQTRALHPVARQPTDERSSAHMQVKDAISELIQTDPDTARTILKEGLNRLSPNCRADVIRSAFSRAQGGAGGSVQGGEEPDLVDHVFNTVDENRDNQLNRTEFRNAVAAYAELREESKDGPRDAGEATISGRQLLALALVSGTPFIFFGFMDNAGMLVFGEMVDSTIGVRFGLSAMASAAFGNLISDVLGVSLSQMIDNALKKMGLLKEPNLSMKQRAQPSVRRSRLLGAMIGITFGGVIGMTPLLFI